MPIFTDMLLPVGLDLDLVVAVEVNIEADDTLFIGNASPFLEVISLDLVADALGGLDFLDGPRNMRRKINYLLLARDVFPVDVPVVLRCARCAERPVGRAPQLAGQPA